MVHSQVHSIFFHHFQQGHVCLQVPLLPSCLPRKPCQSQLFPTPKNELVVNKPKQQKMIETTAKRYMLSLILLVLILHVYAEPFYFDEPLFIRHAPVREYQQQPKQQHFEQQVELPEENATHRTYFRAFLEE